MSSKFQEKREFWIPVSHGCDIKDFRILNKIRRNPLSHDLKVFLPSKIRQNPLSHHLKVFLLKMDTRKGSKISFKYKKMQGCLPISYEVVMNS